MNTYDYNAKCERKIDVYVICDFDFNYDFIKFYFLRVPPPTPFRYPELCLLLKLGLYLTLRIKSHFSVVPKDNLIKAVD